MPDRNPASEVERLTVFLHGRQLHPDWRYSMTFEGNMAHKSREGWEPNPHAPQSGPQTPSHPREIYWMQRTEETGHDPA
jgi:hypothetical protein